MKYYIVGIGGTGHRSIEAMIHLAAAGLMDCDEIKLMFVDSDSNNGNFTEKTKATLQAYMSATKDITNQEGLFNTKIKAIPDIDQSLWSPVEGSGMAKGLADPEKNLVNLFKYEMMSSQEKSLFDFLFTEKERKTALVEGFYGHPSIGATMIAQSLDTEEEPWRTFISNMIADVKSGNEVRLFFVGSIFGGTGAAGIPILSRLIKEKVNNSKLKIAACLVLPYFKFDGTKLQAENEKLKPDSGSFLAKSKAALFYYDNQQYCQKYFDRTYVIGDTYDEFTEMNAALGNYKQNNKAHIVELYIALAIADFMNDQDNSAEEKVFLINRSKNDERNKEAGSTASYIYQWQGLDNVLGGDISVRNKLAQMLRFSVAYTQRFYPIIKEIASDDLKNSDYKAITWYKYYFLDNKTDIHDKSHSSTLLQLEKIDTYCRYFINWIHELHRFDNNVGSVKFDPKIELFHLSNVSINHSDKVKNNSIHMTVLDGFSDMVYGGFRNENGFDTLYHSMCQRPNNATNAPAENFLVQLYNYSKLS